MRCLVTGGAGFIGSHICERLLNERHDVICVDNFDPYYDPAIKQRNIEHLLNNDRFTLVRGDIFDERLLQEIFDGVDYVFHEAAQAGVRTSTKYPLKSHEVNATGTLKLLQASLDSDVKKFVNASSSSVYGKVAYLPFDEEHPLMPTSPYGVSKLAAEHYCRVFNEIYGLKTISLRYFTVFGPRMRPDLAVSIFTQCALKNETIEIFGNGEKTRDFTYIDNVVDANMLAMKRGSGEYNIGGGRRISINELAARIVSLMDSSSKLVYTDAVKGDVEHTWANTEKAKKELGYSPNVDLNNGLQKYVEWYRGVYDVVDSNTSL